MSSRSLGWLAAFVMLGALALRAFPLWGRGGTGRAEVRWETVGEVRRRIMERYVEEVPEEQLFYGAMKGMAATLDPHSQFLPPEEYEEMDRQTTGKFGGVGMEISQEAPGVLVVITPIMGTPAHKAGILPGDRLLEVNGRSVRDMTVDLAANMLRGEPGTEVKISVEREGEDAPIELTLVREIIRVKSVKIARMLEGEPKIGYVLLGRFQEDTAKALDEAISGLESQGMAGLVLDLRMNSGGLLSAAVETCDLFLDEGVIVETRGRTGHSSPWGGEEREVFRARAKGTHPRRPMAVLTDEGTASAAEICAGALRDHGLAILVGQKTYGKGSVQSLMPVDVGSGRRGGLKLTTAYYYLPSGDRIHGRGIEPDVHVARTREQTRDLLRERHRMWIETNNPGSCPRDGGRNATGTRPESGGQGTGKPFLDGQLAKAVEVLRSAIADGRMPVSPRTGGKVAAR
ncbi:MAG: S41 family peptidase [Planctomycetota bacterium]|nr:S41 family peptidase [Planctomycetota bacterium]